MLINAKRSAENDIDKLIGKSCGCEFDMPAMEWPVPGYPAWIVVLSVDMPMIEMRSQFWGAPFWVNASKIKRVWDTTPNVELSGGCKPSAPTHG